jgi:hypothetical protein
MVRVDVPVGVLLAVETVRVEFPEPVTDVGLNWPVAPDGKPLTLRLTVPVNPFKAVTVVVYVVWLPCVTVCELGLAETEKSAVPLAAL